MSDVLLLVGRLNYVWTNTESLLIYIIAHLLKVEKEAAIVVFLTLNTTRARMDLVERLAKLRSTPVAERKAILGAMARLKKESKTRNKYNHCIYAFDENGDTALSNQKMINLKRLRLETIVYRLRAEAQGEKTFKVPAIVMAEASDPDVNAIIQGQNVVFHSKQIKLEEQLNLVEKNIRSLEFRFVGYKGQKASFERQQSLLEQERDSKAKLARDGVIRKTDMLALERAIADAMGDISRLDGEMNQSEAEIAKFRQEAVIAVNSNKQAALDALETAEADLDGVRQQLREAEQVLERTIIRSPVNGTVIRSYYHTAGGVITTGKPIMEILPAHVPLILEAQVLRTSIDQLHEGQMASIRLSALNRRTTPVLDGKVFYVSADSIEENAGMQVKDVYIVRVQISDEELAKVHGFHPVPGMPADVMIQTSERTFFEYLTKPIADSMSRAFKER